MRMGQRRPSKETHQYFEEVQWHSSVFPKQRERVSQHLQVDSEEDRFHFSPEEKYNAKKRRTHGLLTPRAGKLSSSLRRISTSAIFFSASSLAKRSSSVRPKDKVSGALLLKNSTDLVHSREQMKNFRIYRVCRLGSSCGGRDFFRRARPLGLEADPLGIEEDLCPDLPVHQGPPGRQSKSHP